MIYHAIYSYSSYNYWSNDCVYHHFSFSLYIHVLLIIYSNWWYYGSLLHACVLIIILHLLESHFFLIFLWVKSYSWNNLQLYFRGLEGRTKKLRNIHMTTSYRIYYIMLNPIHDHKVVYLMFEYTLFVNSCLLVLHDLRYKIIYNLHRPQGGGKNVMVNFTYSLWFPFSLCVCFEDMSYCMHIMTNGIILCKVGMAAIFYLQKLLGLYLYIIPTFVYAVSNQVI